MRTPKPPSRLLIPAWLALLAAPGCRRDEVTHTRVPKETAAPAPAAGAMPAPAGPAMPVPGSGPGGAPMAGGAPMPSPPRPEGKGALKWTLPRGWTEGSPGGMRFATLKPPGEGKLDVSVVVLPGPAGGELANVNRWRGQIGLAPMDEAELDAARRPVKTRAGRVGVYEFEGEGQTRSRMIAGLVTAADGNTWFVKMVGDSGPVSKARPDFLHLVESLRFE